jgi:signal transduction histidine kinase
MSGADLETIAVVSDLIRGLRHELGNLTTVLAFDITQIEDHFRSKEASPDVVADLKADVQGLREILTRLKQYPQPTFTRTMVDLTHILSDAAAEGQCIGHPFRVQVSELLPNHEVWLSGDDDGLFSVFLNLINNAIEANVATGGRNVNVTMSETPDEATVTISDEGHGFSPEMLELAFQPSYTTRITNGFLRGLGLGLFSANAVVRLHGGVITLDNRPERRGALVKVRLPLAARQPHLAGLAAP